LLSDIGVTDGVGAAATGGGAGAASVAGLAGSSPQRLTSPAGFSVFGRGFGSGVAATRLAGAGFAVAGLAAGFGAEGAGAEARGA
jgi:hypothetical protein